MINVMTIQGVRGYVDKDNTVWLNVEDVARGLGFTQTQNKGGKLYTSIRWERVNKYLADFGFPQKVGENDFIPESMFYRLVWKSRDENALAFQAKVADEILPAIRKYGYYVTPNKIDEIVRDPERFIEELMSAYKRVKSERDLARAQVAELKPKADYCQLILQSDEALPVTVIAKDYGMSAIAFNQLLKSLQIQHPVGKTWVLNQQHAAQGYMKSITTWLGEGHSVTNSKWTQKGRNFLYHKLKKAGILPLIERDDFYPMNNLFEEE